MTQRYAEPEQECSNEEFELRQAERQTSPVLDDVIAETESSLSLDDFEPAEMVRAASFDPKTKAGGFLLWEALNGKHGDLIGRGEFEAAIEQWCCFRKSVQRQNGEIEDNAWVCVWWLSDGTIISSASLLTCKQWANAVRAIKSMQLPYPVRVRFTPNPSKIKGGNPWYSILPVKE